MEGIGEHFTHYSILNLILLGVKVNQCRNQLSKDSRLAIWDFEFAVMKRTILRRPCVRGLAMGICYESFDGSTVYARALDLFSLQGASDHILEEHMGSPSASGKSLIVDKVLLDADVKVLHSQSSEIFKSSSNDSKDITKRFRSLVEVHPFLKLAFVVVNYSSRKADLMLNFGMDQGVFERTLQKSFSAPAPDNVRILIPLCDSLCPNTVLPETQLPSSL